MQQLQSILRLHPQLMDIGVCSCAIGIISNDMMLRGQRAVEKHDRISKRAVRQDTLTISTLYFYMPDQGRRTGAVTTRYHDR